METNDEVGAAGRLHQIFEAVGLALLSKLIGSKRAGQEHLQTYRVVTGGMAIAVVVCGPVTALGAAAAGVATPAAIGIGVGFSFLGAFLGLLFGMVLRVVAPPSNETALTREKAADEKKTR